MHALHQLALSDPSLKSVTMTTTPTLISVYNPALPSFSFTSNKCYFFEDEKKNSARYFVEQTDKRMIIKYSYWLRN